MTPFRHIAIEGVIGVGKSTLARRLAAHLGHTLLIEQADDNPYLARYYEDPAGYAFQTQVFFLLQRLRQMTALVQPGMFSPPVVSDFMFAKDALFAKLTLADEEYRLYRQLHDALAEPLPQPDLVLWLQAPADVLLGRVKQRGRAMEQAMEPEYLQRLHDAYAAHFETFDAAPVLVVHTAHFHPAARDADLHSLLAALENVTGPRTFVGAAVNPGLA